MSAKKGFQRLTIDIPIDDHLKLKLMATVLGKSMHSVIVEGINSQIRDFKGMKSIQRLKKQNGK